MVAMTEILLFTKPECKNCDYVKARIPQGVKVTFVDTSTASGLAEAAYYELLNAPTPILVVDDCIFTGTINIMNKLKELCPSE